MATETSLREDEKSIRLFKSDFLEFFTHISPIIVLVVFLPLIGYLVWRAAQQNPDTWWNVLISFLIGLAIWPLAEYLLHRFLFHWQPKNPSLGTQRFLFLMHGVHHATPRDKTRLVMPPVVSLPMAAIFYLLFWLVAGKLLGAPNFVDMTHYALHHFHINNAYFRKLRRHHMAHHFKDHTTRFGVSTWFWDNIFKTNPAE